MTELHWKLFEELYEAHTKRKAVERCHRVKEAMIAGVWANGNYDPQKEGAQGARNEILQSIEESFSKAIKEIYDGPQSGDQIDWEDPFFAAVKAPRIRTEDAIQPVEDTEVAREKQRFLNSLDQT